MTALQFTPTREEREYLISLLRVALGETRVEERRTDTPTYKNDILRQEALIRSLLDKLRENG